MAQITDIKIAKGKKSRRQIYIDDNFACTLDEFTVFKYGIVVGSEITIEKLEQITVESENDNAFELSVNLISKTPKTRKQVYDYLRGKGYLPQLCNSVIEKLIGYGYIDDEQYAKIFADTHSQKFGKTKIKYKLLEKGVSAEIIDEVLCQLPAQENAVMDYAMKYMKNKEYNNSNFSKLSRFLASKGFGWAEINSVISKLKEGNYEDWD